MAKYSHFTFTFNNTVYEITREYILKSEMPMNDFKNSRLSKNSLLFNSMWYYASHSITFQNITNGTLLHWGCNIRYAKTVYVKLCQQFAYLLEELWMKLSKKKFPGLWDRDWCPNRLYPRENIPNREFWYCELPDDYLQIVNE